MSNNRYIEFSSTYRNRNIWPLASEFEIPIAQSGRNNESEALDPVSDSMPCFAWTSNNLLVGVVPSSVIPSGGTATVVSPGGINMIGYSSDTTTFIILTSEMPQQLKNYYYGLIINDDNINNSAIRRILFSLYLGLDSTGLYRTQITLLGGFSDTFTFGDNIFIHDPTDFTDPNNPLIWVPNGPYQENAFNGQILYNETINQYRPIVSYDISVNMLTLDTSGSVTSTDSSGPIIVGGVGNWNTTDNFSIRKKPPVFYPILGNPVNPLTVVSGISSTITVNCLPGLSQTKDYYKNYFLRIQPYSGGISVYNWNPVPSNNKGYRIISSYRIPENTSLPCTGIGFNIYPSLPSALAANTPLEILPFSYDNFNPFAYTGSLVSQQEMVCYELQLSSLTLPNAVLKTGYGGRIAFYPFVYVQISNVSASGAGLKNIIYSNNPNSINAIFRAPIYDVQNPLSTPFVRIDASGMTQTIKFKPNDNLYFKVSLPNGDNFETILEEYFSPQSPNPFAQISALFSFRRV